MSALLADDCVVFAGGAQFDRDGYLERNTVDEAIHDGRAIAVRSSWTGTHEGGFVGVPPTGRAIGFTALSINHVADGRIGERWILADVLRVLQQVGDVSWGAAPRDVHAEPALTPAPS